MSTVIKADIASGRPACERGARIETHDLCPQRGQPRVAPRANAGRGLKLRFNSNQYRIEDCRPACERGARIETIKATRMPAPGPVAPRANAGRGLKLPRNPHRAEQEIVAPRANAG